MKKLYILGMVTGLLLGTTASAQVKPTKHPAPDQNTRLDVKQFSMNSRLATRAAELALPDSMIEPGMNGALYDYKEVYTYSETGLMTEMRTYRKPTSSSEEWGLHIMFSYKYDELGRKLKHIFQNYSYGNSVDITYSYDGNKGTYKQLQTNSDGSISYSEGYVETNRFGQFVTDIQVLDINGDGIVDESDTGNKTVTTHEYDDSGRLLRTEYATYHNPDNSLNYRFIDIDEYNDSGELTREIYEEYDPVDNSVTSRSETVYKRDGRNYEYTVTYSDIDPESTTSDLVVTGVNRYKHDVTEGNPEIETDYQWSNTQNDWEITSQYYYYYPDGPVTNTQSIEKKANAKIVTYKGSIRIEVAERMPVQICDILGSCHYNATISGCATISGLTPGIYVVRVGEQTLKARVR